MKSQSKFKTELTIEESQHLIDLGVDPKLANKEVALTIYEAEYNDPRHPVFTLDDVIGILPNQVSHPFNNRLQIYFPFTNQGEFIVGYAIYEDRFIEREYAPELIDALYQLLCWTLKREPKTQPNG